MPAEQTGGDIEVLRGDLARVLYESTVDATEYIFGDSVTAITDHTGGVHVTFERGERRTFDLVVGADGQHSRVRALAFGPEESFLSTWVGTQWSSRHRTRWTSTAPGWSTSSPTGWSPSPAPGTTPRPR